MGVVFGSDVVSLSFPGSSREILEYSGLPTGANRLRAGLPTLGHLRLGQRPPSSFLLSDRAGFYAASGRPGRNLWDEDRSARFDVDGLPRLVQIQAEGFLHNESFSNQGSVQ